MIRTDNRPGSGFPLWLRIGMREVLQSPAYCPIHWIDTSIRTEWVIGRIAPWDLARFDRHTVERVRAFSATEPLSCLLSLRTPDHGNAPLPIQFGSFICPPGMMKTFLEAPVGPDDVIPYVDDVLPEFVDIHGLEMRNFALQSGLNVHHMEF